MGAIWQDLRYAVRGIARTPFVSIAVLFALSVGIGLNAAVFALLNDFWFRAPVEKDPASFVQVIPSYTGWFETENQFHGFTVSDYEAIRAQAKSVYKIAGFSGAGSVKLDNESAEAGLGLVTCNFFDTYGWTPVKGRLFLPQECSMPGSASVVVVSEALWHSHFSADPLIAGKTIHINQQPYTVVGVVRFRAPLWMRGGLWVPYTMQPQIYRGYDGFKEHPDYPWLSVFGRLKPGHSRSDALAELKLIQSQQDHLIAGRKTVLQVTNGSFFENPQTLSFGFLIVPLIMGPMVLILLVACTNVTMLLLSRSAARRSEIAIRIALGAGRAQLLRMLATEGAIIAAAAGAVSLYLANVLPGILEAFLLPRGAYRAMGPDWRVFAYLAGVTLLAAGFAGLAPAKTSLKGDILSSLKGQEGAATGRSRARSILVIAQMAMSFVLVAAGVLHARLQRSVLSMDPGFETRQVLVVPLAVSMQPYTQEWAASFYRTVRERVRELPGVRSASYTNVAPFSGEIADGIRLPGEPSGEPPVVVEQVSTDFFATLGITIVRGRAFQDSDANTTRGASAAIVSQAFAAAFWRGQDPLEKVVTMPDNTRLRVVGVARNLMSSEFDVPDGPRLYIPQSPQAQMGSLMVRLDGEARSLAPAIAHAIRNLDAAQLVSPHTVRSSMEEEAGRIRPFTDLVLMMALITLLLAVSGVYGTVAFAMSQRTREIGIRTALGATKGQILGSVLLSGTRQIVIGLFLGLLLALPAAFAFRALLRSSSLFDWSTYFVAGLVLAVAALSAYYVPARRAMQADPIVALRYE